MSYILTIVHWAECCRVFKVFFFLPGLTLEFNIQQSEYISALAPDAGIRVSIHERGTYPFPEDDGFTISPGSASSVALRQVNNVLYKKKMYLYRKMSNIYPYYTTKHQNYCLFDIKFPNRNKNTTPFYKFG